MGPPLAASRNARVGGLVCRKRKWAQGQARPLNAQVQAKEAEDQAGVVVPLDPPRIGACARFSRRQTEPASQRVAPDADGDPMPHIAVPMSDTQMTKSAQTTLFAP